MPTFIKNLNFSEAMHLAGLAAISTLTAIGTVPITDGLPLITALVGLGITINGSSSSQS